MDDLLLAAQHKPVSKEPRPVHAALRKPARNQIPSAHHHYDAVASWELVEGSIEGDVGEWMLARRDGSQVHLVAYGIWEFGQEYIWAGHLLLSAAEWSSSCQIC
jgi:hypothetical protein